MSESHERDEDRPQSALEEVLREVEDAETRDPESEAERRHRGEAGDATSPNTGAQEDSMGD
ncbi:hypothetical protein L1I79_24655 [Strepomyces sp. STD 3.1]|uniref:hypothetical protein n=1 Tax=Streptomyces sp. NPDC058985 TaxID=3346684 RepID=UPI001F3CCF76|nr:hypothetical protein [Streptomyces sp. STD 3.1]